MINFIQGPAILVAFMILFFSCKKNEVEKNQESYVGQTNIEAREDSIELANAYKRQSEIKFEVIPVVETSVIQAESEEDAADDPAIYVNKNNPEDCFIYGSNKQGGIAVYNLEGQEMGYYSFGKINNIDVLYDLPFNGKSIDILGGSNRSTQSIELWQIIEKGELGEVVDQSIPIDTNLIDDIYGFCFARNEKTYKNYCLINGKNGLLQQYEIINSDKKLGLKLVRSVQFDSQTEGMVCDNEYGVLYVGQEEKGIWKLDINPESGNSKELIVGSTDENPAIHYDIEGLTIYEKADKGYLLASSQGNFTYAVFERNGKNKYLGSFKISASENIDGVEETDGIDVVSEPLGNLFPNGLFVVQDGFNFKGENMISQNFKYVDWNQIDSIIQVFEN